MKKFSGFRMGQSTPFLGKASLDQTADASEGEPNVSLALRSLRPDEISEYNSWGPAEKILFLKGYQWLAVATARDLERPDGTPFKGFLPEGITTAVGMLSVVSNYVLDLEPILAQSALEMTNVVKDAQEKTLPESQGIISRYRLLRDRIAWEMANAGVTVQFDVVGSDPANPNVIYQRTIGENRAPDLALVFSSLSPEEMIGAGKAIEKSYESFGVGLELSGSMLGAGALPILGIVIAAIVGVITFFALFWNHTDRAKLDQTTVDLVMKDPNLSDAQRAELLSKIRQAESFFGQLFGTFPWTALMVTGAIALIAIFGIPAWINASEGGRAK